MARPRIGTLLGAIVVGAIVAMWLYLFLVADPGIPDQLDDDTFPTAAEEVCAEVAAEIEDLPLAQDMTSPEERGAVVDQANELLAAMLVDLRAIAPTEGRDARLTRLWLEDWDTYLSDRVAYAEELLQGEDVELLVTARVGDQITETIDNFARVNDMLSCSVPLDA